MPTFIEYKAIQPQATAHSFCSSVIFLGLVARIEDDEKFTILFTQLFGNAGILRLQRELGHYQSTGHFPASLPQLVQEQFFPRLAAYLRDRGTTFLSNSVIDQIEISAQEIEKGQIDIIAQQALAHLLQVRIQLYAQNAQRLLLSMSVGESELVVAVLGEKNQYQPLIEVTQLNDAQELALQAIPTFTFQSVQEGLNTSQALTDDALKSLVQQTMAVLPKQLEDISSGVPVEPTFDHLASTALSVIRLDRLPPDLQLRDLTLDLPALRLAYQKSVVLFEGDLVESPLTWAGSISKTLFSGMSGGALGLGVAHTAAEIGVLAAGGVVGTGATAVSVACVPVFVTCTLLTLIGGAVGKGYAQQYKTALKEANRYIAKEDYESAAKILDAEFNRWGALRVLRSPFLTKAHYAVAHFFRGMCAEMLDNSANSVVSSLKKAYEEYQQALADAKKTDAKVVILLLHVKLINLLRAHGQSLLSPEQRADDLIRTHLDELNHYFQDSLTHLYWQARKNMTLVAVNCYTQQQLSPPELAWTKGVLNIQSLFMLDAYQDGRGTYLQVFHHFFQALAVAYFQLNHPRALSELGFADSVDEDSMIDYVITKLSETFTQFNLFKKRYPALARQAAFVRCHAMMTSFAQQCAGLILSERTESGLAPGLCQALMHLANQLGLDIQVFYSIADKHRHSTSFLMRLEAEFKLPFKSIESWLLALNDPRQSHFEVVSPQTHHNMLHMLAQLPEGMASVESVSSAARRMKGMIYARSHEHHTPLSYLKLKDPYGMMPLLKGEKLISLGSELDEVDRFISSVERNVNAEGHFLLLQGPPGTGKTETVLTYLRSKGHVVSEWQGGDEGDQYVGQLSVRVKKFFQEGVGLVGGNSSRAVILFIDEMSGVCPDVTGNVQNGRHNQAAVVDEFQKQISALKGRNVILIGATNYPERLSKAIQNRMARVTFPVLNREGRQKLLTHLLREKCIAKDLMTRMVDLTQGWSPRQLAQMVEQIEEVIISKSYLDAIFEKSRKVAQSDFRTEFSCAHLMLPQFEIPAANPGLVPEGDVRKVFEELQQFITRPELYHHVRMHTLLYGPPGSGKTTAMREFARQNNCPFILIESGMSARDMVTIFERAKAYTSAIICIDEIDQIAYDGSPVKVLLQEQMDGLVANNIIIVGATNYPDRIAGPIFSRFSIKVAVPLPTLEQIGLFIQQRINEEIDDYPRLQLDPDLQVEMAQGCPHLSRVSNDLSYRDLTNAFGRLFAQLKQAQASSAEGCVVKRVDIIECINQAKAATREAVLRRAEEMNTPRRNHQFFPLPGAANAPLNEPGYGFGMQ